ncbi:LytTR family DNA-binding domain-containing protein [Yoonia sp. R2-816]|uniref:LytTR family DNA-binding domain-containing protein n=1 Tax=Yoonia sp. R2-816 TaxID=3342638 RepID=UPI00372BDB46
MGFWLLRKSLVVLIMVVLAVVVGPFGTYEALSLSQRAVYWSVALLGVGFFMEVAIVLTLTHPALAHIDHYIRLFGAVLFAAVPGAVVILFLEGLYREVIPTPAFGLTIWLFVAVVGCIMGLIEYRKGGFLPVKMPTPEMAPLPPEKASSRPHTPGEVFLRRLRPDLGRELVSLSIQDHYLEVVTRAGSETLLMRMADAEAELDGYPGMRVHRSHWVGLDAVKSLNRSGNKWTVDLHDGRSLPVSRELAPELRGALDRASGSGMINTRGA